MDFHASDMTNEGDTSEARDRAVAERRRVAAFRVGVDLGEARPLWSSKRRAKRGVGKWVVQLKKHPFFCWKVADGHPLAPRKVHSCFFPKVPIQFFLKSQVTELCSATKGCDTYFFFGLTICAFTALP
jgi:hypothetical protein